MKIQKEQFAELLGATQKTLGGNADAPAKYRDSGKSFSRFCWDLLWCMQTGGRINTKDYYEAGLSDAHIETAIKRAVVNCGIEAWS